MPVRSLKHEKQVGLPELLQRNRAALKWKWFYLLLKIIST